MSTIAPGQLRRWQSPGGAQLFLVLDVRLDSRTGQREAKCRNFGPDSFEENYSALYILTYSEPVEEP